jgi:hypothetical protein
MSKPAGTAPPGLLAIPCSISFVIGPPTDFVAPVPRIHKRFTHICLSCLGYHTPAEVRRPDDGGESSVDPSTDI